METKPPPSPETQSYSAPAINSVSNSTTSSPRPHHILLSRSGIERHSNDIRVPSTASLAIELIDQQTSSHLTIQYEDEQSSGHHESLVGCLMVGFERLGADLPSSIGQKVLQNSIEAGYPEDYATSGTRADANQYYTNNVAINGSSHPEVNGHSHRTAAFSLDSCPNIAPIEERACAQDDAEICAYVARGQEYSFRYSVVECEVTKRGHALAGIGTQFSEFEYCCQQHVPQISGNRGFLL